VCSPNNWPHGLQKDGRLAYALASHSGIHFFLVVHTKEEEDDKDRHRGKKRHH
jgi:hypothetical protein